MVQTSAEQSFIPLLSGASMVLLIIRVTVQGCAPEATDTILFGDLDFPRVIFKTVAIFAIWANFPKQNEVTFLYNQGC